MHKIAVIGEKDSVLAFSALGVDTFSPESAADTRNIVDRLAREKYGVIYITEALAEEIPETIHQYKSMPIPAIILIPDSKGSMGLGLNEISKNVEKAVGMDIFRTEDQN